MNPDLLGMDNGNLGGVWDLGWWILGLLCAIATVFAAAIASIGHHDSSLAIPGAGSQSEGSGSMPRAMRQTQAFEMFGRLSRPRADNRQ